MQFGLVPPEVAAALSGRALLEGIVAGRLPQAPICATLGFWLAEVGEGRAVFEGETGANLLNPMGGVHGGWALTLIDSATGCAGLSLLEAGFAFTTLETKANFTRPIQAATGRVRCAARVIAVGRQIITAEASVTDTGGKVLAHGLSTLMVLGPRG